MTRLTLSKVGPLLRERRGSMGIREAAREIGISSATLSRVENGKLPDLESFSKICRWLNIDPGEVLNCRKEESRDSRIGESKAVYAHLRADRVQSPDVARALAEMILAAQSIISENIEDHSGKC